MMRLRECINGLHVLFAFFAASSSVGCTTTGAGAPAPGNPSAIASRDGQAILRIIGTNDFHGGLEARPNATGVMMGGAVALAGAINRARSECTPPRCYAVLVDAGDEFQGQAASTIARGKPVSEIFNALGYDVAAMGNHDLDWGADTLRLRMAEERYPVLSANYRRLDGRSADWIKPTAIIRRGPFVVGVIGIMTLEANAAIMAKNLVGFHFVDPVPIVDSLAVDLRRRGANIVILAAHSGGRCDATGTADCHGEMLVNAGRFSQKIDAIVSGHSHELVNTSVNGIPITGARTAGQAIGVIDLALGGRVVAHDVRFAFPDSLPRDTTIARMVSAAIAAVGPRLNAPITTLAATSSSTTLSSTWSRSLRLHSPSTRARARSPSSTISTASANSVSNPSPATSSTRVKSFDTIRIELPNGSLVSALKGSLHGQHDAPQDANPRKPARPPRASQLHPLARA